MPYSLPIFPTCPTRYQFFLIKTCKYMWSAIILWERSFLKPSETLLLVWSVSDRFILFFFLGGRESSINHLEKVLHSLATIYALHILEKWNTRRQNVVFSSPIARVHGPRYSALSSYGRSSTRRSPPASTASFTMKCSSWELNPLFSFKSLTIEDQCDSRSAGADPHLTLYMWRPNIHWTLNYKRYVRKSGFLLLAIL